MSAHSSLALQQALYNRLQDDATLAALITGVFDYVPQGTPYPYIVINEEHASDWSSATTAGLEMRVAIHCYSQGAGRKQLLMILERVYTLLHDQALAVSGQAFSHVRFVSQHVELQSDGVTYEGVQRFRIAVHE